ATRDRRPPRRPARARTFPARAAAAARRRTRSPIAGCPSSPHPCRPRSARAGFRDAPAATPVRSDAERETPPWWILRRDSAEWRSAAVPVGDALVGVSRPEHGRFIERTADDLHADRQAVRGEAAGQRARGMAREVEGPREPDERRAH